MVQVKPSPSEDESAGTTKKQSNTLKLRRQSVDHGLQTAHLSNPPAREQLASSLNLDELTNDEIASIADSFILYVDPV